MTGFLLDTNVVSERTKEDPAPTVIDFLNDHDDLWLSAIVVEELELGVQTLPQGRRRERLREWLNRLLNQYEGRISPIGRQEAERAAVFQAQARRSGRELELGDALIAGTASVNGMVIVTRNVRDFTGLGVDVINPWETA